MPPEVTYDHHSLLINGERTLILSGAMHYFRLPHRDLWPQRLALIKECGFNAVDIYYAWNYHSPAQGEYDFTGIRDVDYLHRCIEDTGLYLIARPGPYICAEVDAGGFPGWLLAQDDITLRCRDSKGRVRMDKQYLACVREWFEQIVPRITACENLILFQVENEFNTLPYLKGPLKPILSAMRKHDPTLPMKIFGSDLLRKLNFRMLAEHSLQTPLTSRTNPYIVKLNSMARELGVNVPLFHNDILSHSDRVTDVDIAAIDDYALNTFSGDWRGKRHIFASTDIIEKGHDALKLGDPVFIAEFQGGWFDLWGGFGYDHVRKVFGTDQLDIATKTAMSQRATLINYFMYIGGTNWGYLGSPDIYTSADMCAPVAECGHPTDRYRALQWLAQQFNDLCPDILHTNLDHSIRAGNPNVDCRARKSHSGKRYVFLRNLTLDPQTTRLNFVRGKFTIDPVSMVTLVFDRNRELERIIGPFEPGQVKPAPTPEPPSLSSWTIAWGSPQLAPDFDDSGWAMVPDAENMDMDSLRHHYGCVWYRGAYQGTLPCINIDARHCFSVYVNGRLVGSRDNFRNTLAAGPDMAESFNITLPESFQTEGRNVLMFLVESLGHHKGFEGDDARNPRGIVNIQGAENVSWRWRGGLLDGEQGLCPILSADSFASATKKSDVTLPHTWEDFEQGIGLYETTFDLEGKFDPGQHAMGLFIPDASSKVFIYLNGMLLGRYWHEKGPQHKFYLPWGVLKPEGDNHLALAVWRRWNQGGLGRVRLELF